MRAAPVIAGVLVIAAAGMAAVAFTAGGDGVPEPAATPSPQPTVAVAAGDGAAVWAQHGCGSCHTFAPAGADGTLGPDLAASLKGMPAAYIRESIVAPNANAAAGFSTGMMPDDYARRIPPDDLDRLVEYIRSGVGE